MTQSPLLFVVRIWACCNLKTNKECSDHKRPIRSNSEQGSIFSGLDDLAPNAGNRKCIEGVISVAFCLARCAQCVTVLLAAAALVYSASAAALAQTPAVNLDANGWTIFTSSRDTRTIYISSSDGKDTNDGLSRRRPVKTIAKGLSLLRYGYPDWLLLKKGDTWTNETFGFVRKSGRSAVEPILISSYGAGARPLLKTSASVAEAGIGSLGGLPTSGGDFLALVGIEFYAYTADPDSPDFLGQESRQNGVRFLNPSNWLLIEDCKFSFYVSNLDFDLGPAQNVTIRRNVVVDAYGTTSHGQGMYANNIINLLIEENVFDHNGWNASINGAEPTVFNHNIYVQGEPDGIGGRATLRGNILANASSHGAQVRPGGTVTNNLFVHNPIGLLIGQRPSAVANNVFISGNDIGTSLPRGFGVDVNPSVGAIQVVNNIFAHKVGSTGGHGISLAAGTTGVTAASNIFYKWSNPVINSGIGNVAAPNSIDFGGYRDPDRTLETYVVFLGDKSAASDFLVEARKQSKDNWRIGYTANAVNDYIRDGFGGGLSLAK